jgi:phage terminase large subunit-like protein
MPDLEELTLDDLKRAAVARHSFRAYTEFAHNWKPRPHQEIWWTALQALKDRKLRSGLWVNGVPQTPVEEQKPTNKLMIVAFPESGKSDTANEWAEWMIGDALCRGVYPRAGIVSYADEPAKDRSQAIRDFIEQSPEYAMTFTNEDGGPLAVPNYAKGWSAHEWFLTRYDDPGKKDCTMRAAGINGSIWSYRFPTFILIDDPHDFRTIDTKDEKNRVWRTWTSTIRSRAREETPILLICTRWADDDLAGRLQDVEGDWCVIRTTALVPADAELADQETAWPPEDIGLGERVGISTETLKEYERTMTEDFPTQFMAEPPSVKGDLWRWWHYGPAPAPDEIDTVYQFWDTAFNDSKRSAYNVMGEFWLTRNRFAYLNKVYREKLTIPDLLTQVVELYREAAMIHGEQRVVTIVENKASGQDVANLLRGTIAIMAQDIPKMDLVDRSRLNSRAFETGQVYLPEDWRSWKGVYEKEMKGFPRTRYFDQVAMTNLACEYMFPREARGRPEPWAEYEWSAR